MRCYYRLYPDFPTCNCGRVQLALDFSTVLLTKSDFKVARTCPTKLYYRKLRYPTTLEDDEYLQFLSDGGYMVETLAHLQFPGGQEIPFQVGIEEAARQSAELFARDRVTLFEPTFVAGSLMARVDILERVGRTARIIEVKAKSIDTTETLESVFWSKNGVRPTWRPYLEDIAFQTLVLRRLYPDITFSSVLCMPDKSKTTGIDLLHKHFHFENVGDAEPQKLKRPSVVFVGDEEAARADSFLAFVDVSEWVERLLPEVEAATRYFAVDLRCGEVKASPAIATTCAKCEFKVEDKTPSGFAECWGPLADVKPHILDYLSVGTIGGRGSPVVAALLRGGKASLADVTEEHLAKKGGEVGPTALRQRLQRRYTLANEEFKSPELKPILESHAYPLHFIDFEASRIAIPYHAGMRPYEQVCFQWSVHTIRTPGGDIEHSEWINVDDAYPNVEFALSLRAAIGNYGTIYIWSKFEISALKDIREQLLLYHNDETELLQWLDLVIEGDPSGQLRVVDMIDVVKPHYFHPSMKGKTSIKSVLPAVWESNDGLRRHPNFAKYCKAGPGGVLLSPYETLPPLPFGDGEEEDEAEAVQEGTGAIRAYQELLYGVSALVPARKEAYKQALLQYCELDTAAMVIIWLHWVGP